jgi:hypothetical protein
MTISTRTSIDARASKVKEGADYGDGRHGITVSTEVFSWVDKEIDSYAATFIDFVGTPEELFDLARRIDQVVAGLVGETYGFPHGEPVTLDGAVPLDGAAYHPEVIEEAAPVLYMDVLDIVQRKQAGRDCTEDESAEIKRYFDSHPDPDGTDVVGDLFPLELSEWIEEREAGAR